jgi:hypothetical protein
MNREYYKLVALALTAILVVGCTDAQQARIGAYGDSATVICYSAEKVIYEGKSTGKVTSPEGSDGYQFKDASTLKLTEVSGNCVITYGE